MPILVIGGSPEGDKKSVGGMQRFSSKSDSGDNSTGDDMAPDTQKQKEQAARIFFKAGQAGDFKKAASALETFITCCDDGEEKAEGDTEEEGE